MSVATEYPPGYLEEYIGYQLEICLVVFGVLVTTAVSFRFVARRIASIPFSYEDSFILAATAMQLGFVAICAVILPYGGVGYHLPAVMQQDPEKRVVYAKATVAAPLFYLGSVAFSKLSITTLYHRIFPQLWFRHLVYLTQTVVALHLISVVIVSFVQCVPLAKLWHPSLPGSCITSATFFVWISFPNIPTDVVILLLPLPIIAHLHAPKSVRLGIGLTFLVGSIGLVISIARFAVVITQKQASDGTWTAVPIDIWSLAECSTYIIAVSLLSYAPLLPYCNGKILLAKIRSRFGSWWRHRGNTSEHCDDDDGLAMSQRAVGESGPSSRRNSSNSKIHRSADYEQQHKGVGSLNKVSGTATTSPWREELGKGGTALGVWTADLSREGSRQGTMICAHHEVLITSADRECDVEEHPEWEDA